MSLTRMINLMRRSPTPEKQFVGRSGFAGRAGGDGDFSGETGAERRWAHRDCCAP